MRFIQDIQKFIKSITVNYVGNVLFIVGIVVSFILRDPQHTLQITTAGVFLLATATVNR